MNVDSELNRLHEAAVTTFVFGQKKTGAAEPHS